MVNMDTMTPFGADEYGVDATPMLQGEWRTLIGGSVGDGVLGDLDSTELRVTATGSDSTVDVSAGAVSIQGHLGVTTGDTNLDVGSVGTPPAAGQTRIDLVCARLDPVAQTIGLVVLAGSPATTGAVAPATTRVPGGTWDLPLAKITRVGDVAVTNSMITQYRVCCSPVTLYGNTSTLPEDAPDGAIAIFYNDIRARIVSGGAMEWRSIINPPWTSLTMASGYVSSGRAPAYRVNAGHLELRGDVRRSTYGSFVVGAFTTFASVSSTLTSAISATDWPRAVAATTADTAVNPGYVRLSSGGLLQLMPGAAGQTQLWLDGVRIPLA